MSTLVVYNKYVIEKTEIEIVSVKRNLDKKKNVARCSSPEVNKKKSTYM